MNTNSCYGFINMKYVITTLVLASFAIFFFLGLEQVGVYTFDYAINRAFTAAIQSAMLWLAFSAVYLLVKPCKQDSVRGCYDNYDEHNKYYDKNYRYNYR